MTVATKGATILEFTAENVKRLSVVHIKTDGQPVVVVAGDNEAGKSSVLDAIEMALGGKNHQPAKPIRDGQERAEIRLDLGDYIVTRTFTPAGSTLKVTNRDGLTFPSPQALLDGLVGTLTFDPLAFAELDDKAQAATLRALAGVDTSALDEERKQKFDERTLVNRDATQLQGALAKATHHPDLGLDLVDASAIAQQLEAADSIASNASTLAARADQAVAATRVAKERHVAAIDAAERARKALEEAETAELEASELVQQGLQKEIAAKDAAALAAKTVPDRTALRQRLAEVNDTNAKVRDNQARQTISTDLAAKKRESEALTARLAAIDTEKAEQLTAAAFPVKGLGLDDQGVTWNGLPFSQASTAVRVRASVAIGLALNPKLKVLLVRNGNDLGNKNLGVLAEMAAEAGAQLWIERIAGGNGQTTVVIEDGRVAASASPRKVVHA